jgi:hypothetical protein
MNYTPIEIMSVSEHKRKIISLFLGIVVALLFVLLCSGYIHP